MSETSRIREGAFPAVMAEEPVAPQWERIALDSRRPWSLDDRGRVLRIVTGHVDVFAVRSCAGAERPRHHLFRLESGEIVMDLPGTGGAIDAVGVIAVGGPGAEVLMVPRESIDEVVVVVAPFGEEVARMAGTYPVRVARNGEPDGDMAASIRTGRDALSPSADGRGPRNNM